MAILEDARWLIEQLVKDIDGHICRRMRLNMSGAVRSANYSPRPYTNLRLNLTPYLVHGHSLNRG